MGTKPHIIFTVTNDLNYDQRMHRICTSLAQNGYQVTLIGRIKTDSRPIEEKPFMQHRLSCLFNNGKLFYLEFNLRLFFYLLKRKNDATCAIDLDTILPCFFSTRIKGIPCFHDAHEYFAEVPEVVNRPLVKRIWEAVAKKAIPKMNFCYTVSESLASVLKHKYGKTFHVVRNVPWLNNGHKQVKANDKSPFILYQGALNDGRGLEKLIAAMHDIEIPLYLAGEGDLSNQLRQYARKEGLTDKVHFLGHLDPEELKALTPKAFIGFNVLESKGLNYYYSLPNKFFDYLHAGVPILTNDFPEYRKINTDYSVAMLIDLNKDAIVKATHYLLNNPEAYQQMVNNCMEARDVFNWNKEEKYLLQLYDGWFAKDQQLS